MLSIHLAHPVRESVFAEVTQPVYVALKRCSVSERLNQEQQLTWHGRWNRYMRSWEATCVCMRWCEDRGTGVFGLTGVKAREHAGRSLIRSCHHNSAKRSWDHNNVATHKRQDGQMNEKEMRWKAGVCVAWEMDGLMGGWFKWQEKWQMPLDKWMDWKGRQMNKDAKWQKQKQQIYVVFSHKTKTTKSERYSWKWQIFIHFMQVLTASKVYANPNLNWVSVGEWTSEFFCLTGQAEKVGGGM